MNLPQISPDQAFQNVAQVVRLYKGTADEHQALSNSLRTIADGLNKLSSMESEALKSQEAEAVSRRRGRGRANLETVSEPEAAETPAVN